MSNAPAGTPVTGAVRRREQLSDEVAARLRAEIMTGTLRPDSFIRLDETAARLGVSITPVREALRTLRGEGMVELEPHRGHRVVPLTRSDIEDIFWLQSTIAQELAASAARRIRDDQIDELARLNEDLAAAVALRDPDRVARAEFAFHRAFNRAGGRLKLSWFLLHAARYLPPQLFASDEAWGPVAVASHTELIEALRRRDADAVVELTRGQFTDGLARLTAWLEQVGLWD
ncbi:GntR family transcriptional regulator [Mycolicibacterium vaccae]|uniref:GntR family transcriptional regulator n=1 Tax=Mycolicibacterium vaccae ATCC 25954 TaxID=1194972 RepID=K0V9J8_MYCVA|nr:GntR family transcriptional regulator [Mycolicibacterium vaccae]ANI37411.1 GntR family transcriptional regulator [Mycolicibacterium vaccae 95051]EJZ11523.1 GntR family transcriptional regulator [Mycolicibacterium vaccae ATCC 25954]MCV7061210.1 GntR family transcriptional regulator [Mycolicibacterium vaccae]